jgi:uncharacterized membrane protein
MKMNSNKRWLYLPIEIKTRELYGKILLACFASIDGFNVIIGSRRSIYPMLSFLPKGFIFGFGLCKNFLKNYLNFSKKGILYDYIVLLQPTSPLRSYEDIKGAIELFLNNKSDSLISVCEENRVDETEFYYCKENTGIPLSVNHNKGIRRQDLKKLFIRNAAIYITSVEYLLKEKKIISDNPLLFEMPKSRSIDIDTKEDLENFKRILLERKKG